MPRTRWTSERLIHLGVLIGRGFSAKEIAAHRDIVSTEHAVTQTARVYGYVFPHEHREAGLHIGLRAAVLRKLEREARRRRVQAHELASATLTLLAEEPTLLANVLDDDAPMLRLAPAANDNRINAAPVDLRSFHP